MLGEYGRRLQPGAGLVLAGMQAVETDENGLDLAFPAAMVTVNAPAQSNDASAQVVTESFENFVQRKAGGPLKVTRPKRGPLMMDPVETKAGEGSAPRSNWLTGVQFHLNHLGFGAGPVDGVLGPLTKRAVSALQSHYPLLMVDSMPGPRTQAQLFEVCG